MNMTFHIFSESFHVIRGFEQQTEIAEEIDVPDTCV